MKSSSKLLSTWMMAVWLLTSSLLGQQIRVVSVNLWSGLDYRGVTTSGEYESPQRREQRFQILLKELKSLQPDIVAVQEVNPVRYAMARLADSLGYDFIYQRANGGVKIEGLGIPTNLNEGIGILARKSLNLEYVDTWDLSEGFGCFGNHISFHFTDRNAALVGKIQIAGAQLFIVNTHLIAVPSSDSLSIHRARAYLSEKHVAQESIHRTSEKILRNAELRVRQVERLSSHIQNQIGGLPAIVLGDLNAPPQSREIQFLVNERKFVDALGSRGVVNPTWDPGRNGNCKYATDTVDASGRRLSDEEQLVARLEQFPQRIDFIFLNESFSRNDVLSANIAFAQPTDGVFASDHYGVSADIDVSPVVRNPDNSAILLKSAEPEIEMLPILSYDTDAGFGYGAKAFFLNQLRIQESFDLVLFNSTKGERWYRFVASLPDFELRQGRPYPFALDLTIDYDRWNNNRFFGIGNNSSFDSLETYTREPLEATLTASRGFSSRTVGQLSLRYKMVRNAVHSDTSRLAAMLPALNTGIVRANSLLIAGRYDSRNSFVNPSRGLVVQGEVEFAPNAILANVGFTRITLWLQHYVTLFYPKTVLASRFGLQSIDGKNLPVQMLLPIGGTQTLRGSPQDRFLDKASTLINIELRYPIVWRFAGVAGLDAGRVWSSLGEINVSGWHLNPVIGLRLMMDTFVVRADVGFGSETTGFYLNFGHLF